RLGSILPGLLILAGRIENPASRAEALILVFQAIFPAGRQWWLSVLQELVAAADRTDHWRVARAVRDAVLIAGSENPDFARDFVRGIENNKVKAQIERCLARSQFMPARPFFWIEGA